MTEFGTVFKPEPLFVGCCLLLQGLIQSCSLGGRTLGGRGRLWGSGRLLFITAGPILKLCAWRVPRARDLLFIAAGPGITKLFASTKAWGCRPCCLMFISAGPILFKLLPVFITQVF
jgi:hypothetical protein